MLSTDRELCSRELQKERSGLNHILGQEGVNGGENLAGRGPVFVSGVGGEKDNLLVRRSSSPALPRKSHANRTGAIRRSYLEEASP
jgi:hypothetical protein